jgi:hypothetical protein
MKVEAGGAGQSRAGRQNLFFSRFCGIVRAYPQNVLLFSARGRSLLLTALSLRKALGDMNNYELLDY